MNHDSTSVSVLGLGRMGSVIAETFLRNGHRTTVWNRSPGKIDRLTAQGATAADTAVDAVTAGELVVFAAADTASTARLLAELDTRRSDGDSPLRGKDILNVATGRPDEARALAERIAASGGHFLDGAMLAVPQTLATPEALIMYSGSPEARRRRESTLAELGTARYLGADAGLAALHDMAVLAGMYGLFGGFFQAVAMVAGEDTTTGAFTENYLGPWLRSVLDLLPIMADEIDSGDFPVHFSDLSVNATGLENIRTASRGQGVSTELLDPLQRLFDRQVEHGHGGDSFTRAVTGLRPARVPTDAD
ncbi:NAD(P)-dependent oxidoreductase [Nocardia brevicatena]|uniref:NAD(P)-dependent oxidoreductase n=1 Tax=Nocardia brevicatena TaxID=37327 RepID=UPI0002E151A2|nr:NAD(P)-binding domain-containing protein [Nocardia brevicatena]